MQNLPIWRDTQRLLVMMEEAVRRFPRYHKYALGSDMRQQAMLISRTLLHAVNSTHPDERIQRVRQLRLATDELKLMVQTAKEIKAFHNFVQFQQLAELVVAISKQSGAWLKKLNQRRQQPEPLAT